jgi:hypothetical protein
MAKTPRTPEQPEEKVWTPELIRSSLRKLRRRLAEVEAFDPQKVTRQFDPQVTVLEAQLRETLSDVYGRNSQSFRIYQSAASLDTAGINMNGTPLHRVIDGLVHGRARSIELLRSALRLLEEKMEDDFPGEPLDQVALSASTAITLTGGAGPSTGAGIQGAQARGLAGNIRVSIQNDRAAGAVIIADGQNEARFAELRGQVTLLEASLNELRRELASARDKEIGIGHNRGPDFEPIAIEELSNVDDLIALLKEQGPVPPADTAQLTATSQKVTKVSDKIKQYLDSFAVEAFKSAGGEIGKRLTQAPFWMAAVYGIDRVTEALALWLAHVPH